MNYNITPPSLNKSNEMVAPMSDTVRVSNNLDLDHAQHFVGHDLDSNCLQRLSVEDTSRQRQYGHNLKT